MGSLQGYAAAMIEARQLTKSYADLHRDMSKSAAIEREVVKYFPRKFFEQVQREAPAEMAPRFTQMCDLVATVLGTLMAVGISRHTRSGLVRAFAIAPALLPDLLLAIGLLSLFGLLQLTLGLHSVLIAHSVFSMAFVTAIVLARLTHVDASLEEASRDLGAGPLRTLVRVTIPQLAPGILAGALLAFTLSLDEFVIAFFTAAPDTPTLPMVIYSMVRFGVTPEVNALAAMLLGVSLLAVIATQRLTRFTESL